MSIKYEVDYKAIENLEKKIKRIPSNVEGVINSYLHQEGAQIVVDDITKLIPNSQRKNPHSNKRHAKTSNWSKQLKFNLGFTITTKGGSANNKGSFGYLVFPNEGRGPFNPLEQRFMKRGLEKATPGAIERLNELMDRKIKEELG